jgi:predicted outer membrane repeat protein
MLSRCLFTRNKVGAGFGELHGGEGGALFNMSTAIVSACTFSSNSSLYYQNYYGEGGAVFSSKQLTVSNCMFNGNSGANGGGIFDIGNLEIWNSTISGNQAWGPFGGAIYSTGTLRMVSSTVAYNHAGFAGWGILHYPGNDAYVRNSIVDGSEGNFTSEGHNVADFGNDPTDLHNGTLLGPLADNGGPTFTHAVMPGSTALDSGDDTLTGTDQRGRPRRSGTHVDIGAYEFQVPTSSQIFGVQRRLDGSFQLAFTNSSDGTFNVWAATNLSLPATQWSNLGPATLVTNGLFQFNDPATASNPRRFFQLRWP